MQEHKAVMLDEASYNLGDLDLSLLTGQLSSWGRYPQTDPGQRFARLQQASIAVINKVRLDADLIARLPALKLVLLTATGTDNVDLQACRSTGIAVSNVTDYGTPSVAQHVMSMILALSTSLLKYNEETASGGWAEATHFSTLSYPVVELDGKTLGLVGYGTLAKGVETLARAFGMKILIAQRPGGVAQAGRVELDALLAEVDVLSLHCPLVPATQHLMNASAFSRMKKSAILINTARVAVVDNAALAEALRAGEIAGAGIDVLEQEPPPRDHPLLQEGVPNLIVTPHVAWASIESRQRLMDKVADNLRAWLAGEPINDVTRQ
mgnify:FL=1